MIARLVREEAQRFPVLAPDGGWQPADFEDLVGEFLVERIEKVTANLLALAGDEDAVRRLLRKSIRHWLVDQARKTPLGALRRRLEDLLAADVAFERVPDGEAGAGRWRLAGTAVAPWSGRSEDLVKAAREVPNVRIPSWSSDTRRAPVADRASLVAVARAVLTAAGGSLEIAQLVGVFVARFPVVLDPAVAPFPDDQMSQGNRDEALTPEDAVIAADDELDAALTAAQVVAMLSPSERHIVPYLNDPPAIQLLLGCGRSQAYQHARRLKEKLVQLVGDDDVHTVGLEVIRLCGGAAAA